ncbi:hypothetical protein BOTBODRAFT_51694 [Botryobasidium botryosum FD-172 SS1]|uniref:F-box domain-containing protein n=1 Tax=Botryobasidium botryosum (strain FD-172 SS1) TaxID=930990 RepID=A0A067MUE1_BOTB1|nr:hypothetical protein BOTBODRAFT_51694 [Botryobasidium botryosum FD-172 SS1]
MSSSDQSRAQPLVDRLPDDVLIKVFETYSQYAQHWHNWIKKRSMLGLSQVCRRWRELTHSYPLFWTRLHLSGSDRDPVKLAEVWVERSGTCPLWIRIEGFRGREERAYTQLCPSYRLHRG